MLKGCHGDTRQHDPKNNYRVNRRDGKKEHAHGYPQIKSITDMEHVVKRVSVNIIYNYLTTCYFINMNTNLMISMHTAIRT